MHMYEWAKMKDPPWKVAAKYLLHGSLFLMLYFALVFLWVFFLVALLLVGSFIGLIIGLIALFFVMGGLNSFLTDLIWSVPMQTGWKSLMAHGAVLFVSLLVVNIPHVIVDLFVPNLLVAMAFIFIYAFVDGFVARNVANWWIKQPEKQEMMGAAPKSFFKQCVKCGQEIPIASETCPFCGSEQQRK